MWDFLINIALLIVLGLTYVIAGGFATNAAVRTTGIDGYGNNQKLITAHKYLSWAAVIVWVSVGILVIVAVVVIVAGVFFSPEEAVAGAGLAGAGAAVEGAEVAVEGGELAVEAGEAAGEAAEEAGSKGLDFFKSGSKGLDFFKSASEAKDKAKSKFSFINLIIYGAMGLLLLGVITVGILSAVAATDIGESGVTDTKGAYGQSIKASVIAIPIFAAIVIYLGYKFYKSYKTN